MDSNSVTSDDNSVTEIKIGIFGVDNTKLEEEPKTSEVAESHNKSKTRNKKPDLKNGAKSVSPYTSRNNNQFKIQNGLKTEAANKTSGPKEAGGKPPK